MTGDFNGISRVCFKLQSPIICMIKFPAAQAMRNMCRNWPCSEVWSPCKQLVHVGVEVNDGIGRSACWDMSHDQTDGQKQCPNLAEATSWNLVVQLARVSSSQVRHRKCYPSFNYFCNMF